MNKQELFDKIKTIDSEIRTLQKKKRSLREEYQKECCPFKVGDKVRVITNDHLEIGIVKKIIVTQNWEFSYELAAVKKDGTPHPRNRVYPICNSKIEKL